MKLSVDCCVFSQQFGDFKAMEMIKEVGFDAVDYTFCCRGDDIPILCDGYKEYAQDLRKHLDEIGLECIQAHAPIGFGYPMARDMSEPKYVKILRAIEAAAILGAEIIVIHSRYVPPFVEIELYEENIDFYRSLVPYCEKFGIKVGVENLICTHPMGEAYSRHVPETPDQFDTFIKEIGSPWIVGCLDTGHATLKGFEPEEFILRTDKDTLRTMHVQDTDYVDDLHTLPYQGKIDWDKVIDALKKIGYEGPLNFEVPEYFGKMPKELLPDALRMAHAVGRHLVAKFES